MSEIMKNGAEFVAFMREYGAVVEAISMTCLFFMLAGMVQLMTLGFLGKLNA
jgi:hypothetical protein